MSLVIENSRPQLRVDKRPRDLKRRRREAPGMIEPGNLYSLTECRARLGLGGRSWRALLAELTLIRRGNCKFILGSNVIAVLAGRKEGVEGA